LLDEIQLLRNQISSCQHIFYYKLLVLLFFLIISRTSPTRTSPIQTSVKQVWMPPLSCKQLFSILWPMLYNFFGVIYAIIGVSYASICVTSVKVVRKYTLSGLNYAVKSFISLATKLYNFLWTYIFVVSCSPLYVTSILALLFQVRLEPATLEVPYSTPNCRFTSCLQLLD
jgi:hypothetical protein